MNPAKPPVPAAPQALPQPLSNTAAAAALDGLVAALPTPSAGFGVSVAAAGLVLGLGAVLLAAAVAYVLALLWGDPSGPWAAALAAAFGVAAAALPLGWLMLKLAQEAGPGAARAAASGAPPAGMPLALFMELAQREWARARRYGSGAALLLVDVDRYNRLCEARGAAAGDAVLAELLAQTAPTLRTADVLTRYSETQMAVFLAHADATGALDVAERIRERSEQLEVRFRPQLLRLTVSVGVAHLRPAHLHLQALIEDAQDAVAAARQSGGNSVRAAPVDGARARTPGAWRDERRALPKRDGSA